MPEGRKLDFGTPDFVAAEELGLVHFRDAAFVLVAGGLGERLGYSDIKVSLPVESVTETCYLQLYVSQILAMQTASNDAAAAAAAGGAAAGPPPPPPPPPSRS
jgi:UDP-sugar pyrophosphorylase